MLYEISVGRKRTQKKWRTVKYSWDELWQKLQSPVRTDESMAEYARMNRAQKDNIKDVGGFVGGVLKDGIRKNENVTFRSLVTLDIDHASTNLQEVMELLCTYKAILYSTHSHTPDSPRLRLVIPLKRNVTPEEYAAVAKYVADDWGMEMFDACSFIPAQMMYWPSCCRDADPVIRKFDDGDFLDPDVVLRRHPDWLNLANAPKTRDEETAEPKRQADPLSKPGIVGAFCRVYSITAAIAMFLSDVYQPSALDGRYDYIPADSVAGVVVYDDKFAYSHHATDPACGMELNAFDLVRVHKYPDPDEKKSFDEMCEFALKIPEVKKKVVRESIDRDFSEPLPDAPAVDEEEDWTTLLECDKRGAIKNNYANQEIVLRHDKNLQNLAYNKFKSGVDRRGAVPWEAVKTGWSNNDFARLQSYLSQNYGLYGKDATKTALEVAAGERAYHPVIEYLEGLPEWDGIERAETLLIDYFGAPDTVFTREAMLKTLQGAVERVYRPGVKFDTALILQGPQGCGKTTFFGKLGREWYSDSLTLGDMKDKTSAEKLQGYWIMEIAELAGMRKAEIETVKAFMTRTNDQYRPSYGMVVEEHPRQSIVVGSTNAETGFLRDTTGNRRFWVVEVTGACDRHPWDLTEYDISQIWAEIMELRKEGPVDLRLSRDAEGLAVQAQEAAMEYDDRTEIVEKYLNTLLPPDWYDRSLVDRRRFLESCGSGGIGEVGTVTRDKVSPMEVWAEAFNKDPAALNRTESLAITAILKNLGWLKQDKVSRFKGYATRGNYYIRSN